MGCVVNGPGEAKHADLGAAGGNHIWVIFQGGKILRQVKDADIYEALIEEQAQQLFLRLVKELAEKEGVTEQLKSADNMVWVRRMNNIRNRAAEMVNNEVIYRQL